MNKVARFLLTGFVLSVVMILISIAATQTSTRKAMRNNTDAAIKVVLAQ